MNVHFYWGVNQELDTEDIDKWDTSFVGTLSVDDSFNLSPKRN